MNLPRHPLRINVGFLLNAQIGYSRDIHFDFPKIKLDGDLEITNFGGLARVSRTPQGILVQCELTGQVPVDCVRCLEETTQDLKTVFSELYAFDSRSTTESNLILRDDGNIDLEPLAREYMVLEIPISPVCRENCKGLCAVCGENLNLGLCQHVAQPET